MASSPTVVDANAARGCESAAVDHWLVAGS